jgi:hypothetical protein
MARLFAVSAPVCSSRVAVKSWTSWLAWSFACPRLATRPIAPPIAAPQGPPTENPASAPPAAPSSVRSPWLVSCRLLRNSPIPAAPAAILATPPNRWIAVAARFGLVRRSRNAVDSEVIAFDEAARFRAIIPAAAA